MQTKINFYKDKLAINCLAKDLSNAKNINQETEGHACIGLLSSDFSGTQDAIAEAKLWLKELPCLSIGLGAGNPKYSMDATTIAGEVDPGHVNQTFPFTGYTAGYFKGKNVNNTIINSLISPTGTIGKVRVNTGIHSSQTKDGILDVETAIALILDMGGHSVKFFHMKGLDHIKEFAYIAKVCASMGIKLIEPTGGITTQNVTEIVATAFEAGISKCMPHIYTSIINSDTGLTNIQDIKDIYKNVTALI